MYRFSFRNKHLEFEKYHRLTTERTLRVLFVGQRVEFAIKDEVDYEKWSKEKR